MKTSDGTLFPSTVTPAADAPLASIDLDALDEVAGGCACGSPGCANGQAAPAGQPNNAAALLSMLARR